MATFAEQVVVDRSGDWTNPQASIGGESLIVKHSENGTSPGVTFINDGGGHFVQQFAFGANSNLPGNEAATIYADWHGMTLTGQLGMLFSVGAVANAPGVEDGKFVFANADVAVRNGLDVGGSVTASKDLFVTGGVTAGKNLFVEGVAVIVNDLTVGGGVNFAKDVAVQGGVTIGKDLVVAGDVSLSNADCAEEFDALADTGVAPGMVVVLTPGGQVTLCNSPYDSHVVGVISGAGAFRPALVLDHQRQTKGRVPVGLLGKVSCWVDASYDEIKPGDMLTTSSTPGHAMRASDSSRSFGTTIGKAMQGLKAGRALVPVLIALR